MPGMEEAKGRGNRLYVDGKVTESERWAGGGRAFHF